MQAQGGTADSMMGLGDKHAIRHQTELTWEGKGRGEERRRRESCLLREMAEKEKSDPLKFRGLLTFLGGAWMNRVQVSTQSLQSYCFLLLGGDRVPRTTRLQGLSRI